MSNKTYDLIKNFALVYLPAMITCFCAIGEIWQIPFTEQITATAIAIDTMLGAFIKKSATDYVKKKEAELDKIKEINQQND